MGNDCTHWPGWPSRCISSREGHHFGTETSVRAKYSVVAAALKPIPVGDRSPLLFDLYTRETDMIANSQLKPTLIGLLAPMGWGMSVGLIRTITESFDLAAGMAILNGVTIIFLFFLMGFPKLSLFPRKYLLCGIPLANLSTIFFCLSMYLSDGGEQTVEVGMVNYLWPCMVILFAMIFNGQKARWWVIPGMVMSFVGVMLVLGGKQGIDLERILSHVQQNPASYFLAFLGTLAWAGYSNLTRVWSNGQNPTLLIFIVDFLVFCLLWAVGYGTLSHVAPMGWVSIGVGAIVMGGAYAAWSYGVIKGNITLLAIASYFTPVLSCLFATVWIGAHLDSSLWKGVAVLVVGSLLCWSATYFHK